MRLHRVPVVYLAGGMRTNWQDRVLAEVKAIAPVIFIDPRAHGLKDEQSYTRWDIEGVRRADIVFAYLESDNPSGAGLALEIGFARGMSDASPLERTTILFVCDPAHPHYRYFGMARVCSDAACTTLDEGIQALDEGIQALKKLLEDLSA